MHTVLRKPAWLKKPIRESDGRRSVEHILQRQGLHTVCREACCPNLSECFARGTATFLLMGARCTRACRFCAVDHGVPSPLDSGEPVRIAAAARDMGLRHAVLTSVTRDDLQDGGAAHFCAAISALRRTSPGIVVEALTPDFQGSEAALAALAEHAPDIFNHNVETVPRLYHIRPGALFERSLSVLACARALMPGARIKSGLMVGLGETRDEVFETIARLRQSGCDMLCVGQYLAPSRAHEPVVEYVTPGQFDEYRDHALSLGFSGALCGPFVRSSYMADTVTVETETV